MSAGSREGLEKALARWLDQGYEAKRWEEVPLPLEGDDDGSSTT
ncbi:MAG: hypothetical protein ABGW82_11230 [Paracoccus sp. (in: a-proteobacteria)]